MRKFQSFNDKCLCDLQFNKLKVTLMNMEGNMTMEDMRAKFGLITIDEMIRRRKLNYVGHVGRYPDERIAKTMLNAWPKEVEPVDCRPNLFRKTLRLQYWKNIGQVMERSGDTAKDWATTWTQFANIGEVKGRNWKDAVNKLIQEMRKEKEQDTWKNRHSQPEEMITQKAEKVEDVADGRTLKCPKRGGGVHPIGYRKHVWMYDGTAKPNSIRQQCDGCKIFYGIKYLKNMRA